MNELNGLNNIIGNAQSSADLDMLKDSRKNVSSADRPGEKFNISNLGSGSTLEDRKAQSPSKRDAIVTFVKDIPSDAGSLFKKLDNLEEFAKTVLPELSNSDWGISISSENEVVILGEDLTAEQREILTVAAQELGIDRKAAQFRDTVIRGMKEDRGPLESTTHIGRFNLNNDNFGEVVDLKDLKSNSRLSVNPKFDPTPEKTSYSSLSITNALASQLKAKLEPEYGLHIQV